MQLKFQRSTKDMECSYNCEKESRWSKMLCRKISSGTTQFFSIRDFGYPLCEWHYLCAIAKRNLRHGINREYLEVQRRLREAQEIERDRSAWARSVFGFIPTAFCEPDYIDEDENVKESTGHQETSEDAKSKGVV